MLRNKLYVYGDEHTKLPAHMHFGKELLDSMMKFEDIVALINAETGEQLTYSALAQQTINVALSLARIGVKKGDVVSICSDKRSEVMVSMIGAVCAGATFSPCDPTYGQMPLQHRINISRPKVMFCSAQAYDQHMATFYAIGSIQTYIIYGDEPRDGAVLFKDFVTETASYEEFLPTPVDGWRDRAFIIFSSGTTGLPKGVPVTHSNVMMYSSYLSDETFVGMPILNTREWYYTYGMMHTLGCMRGGATIIYTLHESERNYLDTIQKYKARYLQLSPTMATNFIKSRILDNYDVTSVEYILCSSTPIMGEQIDALKDRFPNLREVVQLYGSSEGGVPCSTQFATKGNKSGSVGRACPSYVLKIVDLETRQPVGPNTRGEICFKSIAVMNEYLGNSITGYKDEEGFFLTGDVGYYDDDQYFYIVNRIKELIKYNDISIAPAEFEAILLQHPAVREAGVVGVPHAQHGEVPRALVALQPGATVTEQELVAHLNDRVTFRMRLAGGVKFVDKLPRGAGEKLDRKALKQMLEE